MTDDDIPWCGVFVGIAAMRAGWDVPYACYRAKNWLNFGNPIDLPELGCVVVFERPRGHHVGLYIAESTTHYAILGGNQGNSVNISLIDKSRAIGARECPWRVAKPGNVRRIYINKHLASTVHRTDNEA